MTTHIRFYFDFMSPYAYVNWVNLQRLLREYAGQLTVSYHPISFPALSRSWGSTPASTIPPKMAFIFKDVFRTARNRHMPFSLPKTWPFPSGKLLCLSSATVGGLDQQRIINAIFSSIWGNPSGEGQDLSDESELRKMLTGLGLDADELLTYAKSASIRKELRDTTMEAAHKYNVFGVPTMIVQPKGVENPEDSELFFGNDQILAIRNLLDGGTDPLRSAPSNLVEFINSIPKRAANFPPAAAALDAGKVSALPLAKL